MTDPEDKPVQVPIEGGEESSQDAEEQTSAQSADTCEDSDPQQSESEAEETARSECEQAVEEEEVEKSEEAAAEGEQEPEDWKDRFEREREKRLRAVAELKNYRQRANERQAKQRRFANEKILADLLEVLDNFDQALCSLDAEESSKETILQGVEMIHRQLEELIERHGVERIEPEDARFDPNYHEAVQRVETDECPDMTILEVTSPGYMLHDRVLRPARVRVAVSPEKDQSEQNQGDKQEQTENPQENEQEQ